MKYEHTAKGIAALGRHGDDTLMHVNKDELAGLQALLGPVTVNPETGLPEAFKWKEFLATAGMGLLGAVGAAPIAGALGLGGNALASGAIGAGLGGLGGGAISAAQGHGFGPGAMGGAIAGGLGGFGGSGLTGESTTPAISESSSLIKHPLIDTAGEQGLTNLNADVMGKSGFYKIGQGGFGAEGLPDTYGMSAKEAAFKAFNPEEYKALTTDALAPIKETSKAAVTESAAQPSPSFQDFLGKQTQAAMTKKGMSELFTPVAMGVGIGTMAQDSMIQAQQAKKQQEADQAQAQANAQDQQNYFASLGFPLPALSPSTSLDTATQRNYYLNLLYPQSGYAAGGAIEANRVVAGVPVHTTIPPKYVDEFERSNIQKEIPEAFQGLQQLAGDVGLAAQKSDTRRMANGGYLNNTLPAQEDPHPQSLIPKAQPHPGAAPVRQEVVQEYADGGFLDGPGDGMSDDIPANIDGQEEVRLADGEFVIPPEIVHMLGYGDPEKGAALLDKLLPMVREAAHGKKEQVKQDAGKKVVMKAVGGLPTSGKKSLAAEKAEKRKAHG